MNILKSMKTAAMAVAVTAATATLSMVPTSGAQAQSLENGIRCVLNYPGVGRSVAVARVVEREPFCSGFSCNLNDTAVRTVRRAGEGPELTIGSLTTAPPFANFFVRVQNPVTNTIQRSVTFSSSELRARARKTVSLRVPVETTGRLTCRFRRG